MEVSGLARQGVGFDHDAGGVQFGRGKANHERSFHQKKRNGCGCKQISKHRSLLLSVEVRNQADDNHGIVTFLSFF
jgi:hypothetical protein